MHVISLTYNNHLIFYPPTSINSLWEMLTSAFKVLVKNPDKKSFDITFVRNEKYYQNIKFFFFSHKNFFKLNS